MHLGPRERTLFPKTYKNFRLYRTHGRVFGIPNAVDPDAVLHLDNLFKHPEVLSASTLEEMQQLIDGFDETLLQPESLGTSDGYDFVRLRGQLYAVPQTAPPIDLHLADERRRIGVLSADTLADLEAAIREAKAARPVEFAGWLQIYRYSGNCGTHPQFTHTDRPPQGYRFTCSAPPPERGPSRWTRLKAVVGKKASRLATSINSYARVFAAMFRPRRGVTLRARFRILLVMFALLFKLLRRGCKLSASLRFLQSRHLQSQLMLSNHRGPVFLTSMPFTYGQSPWLIEIEDPTTLFFPTIQNGHTSNLDIRAVPCFPVIKAMLEDNSCKAILTHMKSTARMVSALFESQTIRQKLVYAPLGVKLPTRWQRHDPLPDEEPIHLLFINSWCQVPENFYVRGGLDLLEAFATLRIRYPQIRLTLRTALPALDDHYHRIIESGWVRVINRFLTNEEMAELHASSHIFLLPAARVHIVSLLQAMSYGLAVVASDGWGIEEYLTDEETGLVVKGRYGKVTWADEQAGVLREDYEPMYTSDPQIVEGIVQAVSRLVEDRLLRARLGRAARADVETKFNPDQWNRGLRAAFERAHDNSDKNGQEAKSPSTIEDSPSWRLGDLAVMPPDPSPRV